MFAIKHDKLASHSETDRAYMVPSRFPEALTEELLEGSEGIVVVK